MLRKPVTVLFCLQVAMLLALIVLLAALIAFGARSLCGWPSGYPSEKGLHQPEVFIPEKDTKPVPDVRTNNFDRCALC